MRGLPDWLHGYCTVIQKCPNWMAFFSHDAGRLTNASESNSKTPSSMFGVSLSNSCDSNIVVVFNRLTAFRSYTKVDMQP